MEIKWKKNSWRNYPISQQPAYDDVSHVNKVEKQIEKGIDRLNVIYNMYVKFQIMNQNYYKNVNTNGSILINAIDNSIDVFFIHMHLLSASGQRNIMP